MRIHESAIYATHADHEYHSTYLGHPVVKATSLITGTTHWFSNEMDAETLLELKVKIRAHEGKTLLLPSERPSSKVLAAVQRMTN